MADQKQYYTIKVEALVPAEVVYKVLASNPQEALQMIEKPDGVKFIQPPVRYVLARLRKLGAKLYNYGTLNMLATKKYG